MGKPNDREHFDDYRQQTQVKHDILAAYLPAYFNALKQRNSDLLFVDGFAGRGTYTEAATGRVVDGSPLRALKLIAGNPEFAARVSTVFIEADDELYRQMEQAVSNFATANSHIR